MNHSYILLIIKKKKKKKSSYSSIVRRNKYHGRGKRAASTGFEFHRYFIVHHQSFFLLGVLDK